MSKNYNLVIYVAITGINSTDKNVYVLQTVNKRGQYNFPVISMCVDGNVSDNVLRREIAEWMSRFFGLSQNSFAMEKGSVLNLSKQSVLVNMPYSIQDNLRVIGSKSCNWFDNINRRCAQIAKHENSRNLTGLVPDEALPAACVVGSVLLVVANSVTIGSYTWYALVTGPVVLFGSFVYDFMCGMTPDEKLSEGYIRQHDIQEFVWKQIEEDCCQDDITDPSTICSDSSSSFSSQKPRVTEEDEECPGTSAAIIEKHHVWLASPFQQVISLMKSFNAVFAPSQRS